jgi:hypothetical protein
LSAVEEATAEAAKHGDRSERLAALVAEAKTLIEQARATEAERARVAAEARATAEAAEVAAAVAAVATRARLEEEMAALQLSMEEAAAAAAAVAAASALRMQQVQAELGYSIVPPAEPAPQPAADADEMLCVLCLDAPKDHIIVPCGHQCVCGACAEKLKKARSAIHTSQHQHRVNKLKRFIEESTINEISDRRGSTCMGRRGITGGAH